MKTIIAIAALCTQCGTDPTTEVVACPPGVVVVSGDQPVGCDLRGGINTLVLIDIDQAGCDHAGGVFVAGRCEGADF